MALSAPVINPITVWSKGTWQILTWTAIPEATKYYLQCSWSDTFHRGLRSIWITDPTQERYVWEDLVDGVKYFYRMKAYNTTEESAWSNVVWSIQDDKNPIINLKSPDGFEVWGSKIERYVQWVYTKE